MVSLLLDALVVIFERERVKLNCGIAVARLRDTFVAKSVSVKIIVGIDKGNSAVPTPFYPFDGCFDLLIKIACERVQLGAAILGWRLGADDEGP